MPELSGPLSPPRERAGVRGWQDRRDQMDIRQARKCVYRSSALREGIYARVTTRELFFSEERLLTALHPGQDLEGQNRHPELCEESSLGHEAGRWIDTRRREEWRRGPRPCATHGMPSPSASQPCRIVKIGAQSNCESLLPIDNPTYCPYASVLHARYEFPARICRLDKNFGRRRLQTEKPGLRCRLRKVSVRLGRLSFPR